MSEAITLSAQAQDQIEDVVSSFMTLGERLRDLGTETVTTREYAVKLASEVKLIAANIGKNVAKIETMIGVVDDRGDVRRLAGIDPE